MFEKKTEKIIEQDTNELVNWLNKQMMGLKSGNVKSIDSNLSKTPKIYRILKNDKSEISRLDDDSKKAYATIITASSSVKCVGGLISASVTSRISVFGIGEIGVLGISGIALLNPLAFGGIVAYNVAKKMKKNNNKEILKQQLKETYDKAQELIIDTNNKIINNTKKMNALFQKKLKIGIEIAKKTSKEIYINLDDIKNLDQNKRIMQYQEICLKQYQNQHNLEEILFNIINAYNDLRDENDQLVLKIQEYEKIMNSALITTNGIINN